MNNLLFVFLDQLENEEELDKIIDKFSEHNYLIYVLDNIKSDKDFYMQQLPDLVAFYKNEHENVNKVVVLSNIRDLLFAWYRCYNSVVDDFVYFVDKTEKSYFDENERHYNFYKNLAGFNNVHQEIVAGKIYTNLSKINISRRCKCFFASYEEINYLTSRKKQELNKTYQFDDLNYSFTINSDMKNTQKIKLHKDIEIDNFDGNRLKIIVFKGQSQYDVQRIASEETASALMKLGHCVFIVDLLEPNYEKNLEEVLGYQCDFIMAPNAIGWQLSVGGESLYDALGIPMIALMGDHPLYLYERINNDVKNITYTFLDKKDIEFLDKMNISKNYQFCITSAFKSKTPYKPYEDRSIDVLFAGTIINPAELKMPWKELGNDIETCLNEVVEEYLELEGKTLTDIIERKIKSDMKLKAKYDYNNLLRLLFMKGKIYTRNYLRYELIKIVGDSSIPLTCYSNNAETLRELDVNGNFDIRGQVSFYDFLDIVADSKIVLNLSSHLYEGVTERVLSAMLNGAVCVTDSNKFMRENFEDRKNLILYQQNRMNEVPDLIGDALADERKLIDIAEVGRKKAENNYTAEKLALKIIEVYKDMVC